MNESTINSIRTFVQTLRKMFMIDDAAELDFGIYRIMAQKKAEIESFFGLDDESDDNALCRKIEALLAEQQGASVNVAEIKRQLNDRIRMYQEDGETMEQINKKKTIIELRQKLEETGDPTVMLPHILTALNDFFSRYYDKGDFISQRRYANGSDATYLVPYNGEEVKLHWANADQYYIKTSEAFKNYRFKLKNGKEVEFTLKNAVQLKNNEKEQKDWARRFKLWDGVSEPGEEPAPDFVPVQMEEDGVLHIYFTYELMKKKGNEQNTLNKAIYATLADIILAKHKDDYLDLITNTAGKDTEVLRRHINRYTTKNSSDYFIHKNLGDFLRRELDFYLKNEIMHVSDLDYNNLRRTLAEAKTIKAVGEEIIQMLAALEDFQKKLWLKKKFVVQSDYCITLDRVPKSLYADICANEEQRKEWVRLFAIDEIERDLATEGYSEPLTERFLEENPHLVLDTAFFNNAFKHRLLESMENIDAQCDGLLVNSENFQALELLQEKFTGIIGAVITDPPYNTGEDDFPYKDNYVDSSWLSMINDRLNQAHKLLKDNSWMTLNINDIELFNLMKLLDSQQWNSSNHISIKMSHLSGMKMSHIDKKIPKIKEQIVIVSKGEGATLHPIYEPCKWDEAFDRYTSWVDFNNSENPEDWTKDTVRNVAKNQKVNVNDIEKYDAFRIQNAKHIFRTAVNDSLSNTPKDNKFRKITSPQGLIKVILNREEVLFASSYIKEIDGKLSPVRPKGDIWTDIGINNVHNEGGVQLPNGKKPVKLFERLISMFSNNGDIILDPFAGSATLVHAVMKTNENNKYIAIQSGYSYFNEKTLRRSKNVVYSDEWKLDKPVSRKGSSHCFKYIRLEQYEDTLNNLYRTPKQGAWYEEELGADTIGYVMDMQSQQNWMHTDWMANPFGVKMQIAHGNETTEQTIDVVETFNYLLGLNVEKTLWPAEGMQIVMGTTRRGKRTMIIWRNTAQVTDEEVKTVLYSVDCKPFKQIYINGETTLGTILDGKLRQTETEFEYRMFSNE